MISSPIVPVEVKITGIIRRMQKKKVTTLKEILSDSVSLPDLIAIFLGVLELIKVRKILIAGDDTGISSLMGDEAKFIINENPPEDVSGEFGAAIAAADKQLDIFSESEALV